MENPDGREDAMVAARRVLADRHPDAIAGWLCGGVLSHPTPYSDLDVVVLLDGAPAPYRESLEVGGWPVELFVHSSRSWAAFVRDERVQRKASLLRMTATGRLLTDVDGVGRELQERARRMLAEGPPPVSVGEVEDARYGVSDLLDDLAGCAAGGVGDEAGELLFIVGELSRCTAELALLVAGAWAGGGGKQLARRLEEAVPGLAARLHAAGLAALEGKPDALSAVAREVLDGSGGRLWAGYRRQGYLPGMPEADASAGAGS